MTAPILDIKKADARCDATRPMDHDPDSLWTVPRSLGGIPDALVIHAVPHVAIEDSIPRAVPTVVVLRVVGLRAFHSQFGYSAHF